MQTSTS